jgi:hypothetical protein
MALAFAKEALRVVQDTFPIHETLLSEYATTVTSWNILSPFCPPRNSKYRDLVEVLFSRCSLVRLPSICHPASLAVVILV